MIELSTHIEYLLFSRTNVSVPQLGTFTRCEMSSQRIDEEGIFLPPYRTVKFQWNEQEAGEEFIHSLSKLHHLTRHEARIMCAEYVDELQQAIAEDGTVSIGSMGYMLRSNDNEQELTFIPLQSGIASPSYYGLDALPFAKLSNDIRQQRDKKRAAKKIKLTSIAADRDTITIRINRRAFNYAASVAASIVLFFAFTSPFENTIKEMGRQQAELFFAPKIASIQPTTVEVKSETATPSAPVKAEASAIPVQAEVKEALYAIVVASAISEKNAVNYAAKLQEQGYNAIACKTETMVRVIIKGFETESDAYNQMRQMKAKSTEFANVWSCKVNDKMTPIQ
ncbi:MAG: SPOR domain-containing protein [Bacteroidaceae bacterium]|nr:SPOR domain-containing protein [Bacteroidaceae bacterium]